VEAVRPYAEESRGARRRYRRPVGRAGRVRRGGSGLPGGVGRLSFAAREATAMPFAYYERLSARNKRIYRQSDAVEKVELPDAAALRPLVGEVAEALGDEDRRATEAACQRLAQAMLQQWKLPPVRISVLAARQSRAWGELHGYYDPTKTGVPPTITL